ncbi:HAD-superfamily hydrolase, subfamily IA, variant 3 [Lancefieldella parvula DSM 20469]|uniref:HAD-superfamily hydrolase, subfamily IA, variant 3 n=1 Tax=Lancefieldella parvula (strain ATCC 33793 / DSM 20469 / CCUG 32760 / JCM 10300 / KCTC 3663 / VPI 0546 / 1246) TaxID=521095 RepID=C8W778_LANP1|nr:HAD family phosphatase [Lancefieldella parvula]ACV51318.1 HAD-superfamily hydrolase, subfamily IA, variant 3 [Lancefieldella parvula DSM 20469]
MIFSTLENILATNIEAVIFDFDGTIAHTHHIWKLVDQEFFESRGIPYTPEIGKILSPLGFEKGAEWAISTYKLNEDPKKIITEWKELGKSFFINSVQLRPGVVEFINQLKERHISTALATVNEPELLALLEPRLHLSTLFDTQVFAADVGSAKDEPYLYLEALARLKAKAKKTLLFEDIPLAIQTGNSIDLITCAVNCDDEHQDIEKLSKLADFTIKHWY